LAQRHIPLRDLGSLLRLPFLEMLQAQLKLLNLGIEFFRRPAELPPPQHGEMEGQRLDLGARSIQFRIPLRQLAVRQGVLLFQRCRGGIHPCKLAIF